MADAERSIRDPLISLLGGAITPAKKWPGAEAFERDLTNVRRAAHALTVYLGNTCKMNAANAAPEIALPAVGNPPLDTASFLQ